jgi:hypothetical protein
MQEAKTARPEKQINMNKNLLPAIILIGLIGLGFYIQSGKKTPQAASASNEAAVLFSQISQAELEAQYGLHVNLVAVTAMGGMVDLRLKVVDGEKARSLLQDPGNYPSLWIADGDISLAIPEENKVQEIDFKDNISLFLMFPNGRGIVKTGTPVSIRFGDIQVEPIPAK